MAPEDDDRPIMDRWGDEEEFENTRKRPRLKAVRRREQPIPLGAVHKPELYDDDLSDGY